MSSSSSSTSGPAYKPKIFRVDVESNVYCYHDLLAVKRVAGSRSSREGHEFYGCSLWPRLDCKFFIWKEEVDVLLGVGDNSRQLDLKNRALQLRVSNLEVEKMMLEEENKNLRLQLRVNKFPIKSIVGVILFSIVMYIVLT